MNLRSVLCRVVPFLLFSLTADALVAEKVIAAPELPKGAKWFCIHDVRFSPATGELWWGGSLVKTAERSLFSSSAEDILPALLRISPDGAKMEWILSPRGWRNWNNDSGNLVLDGDRAVWQVEKEAIYEVKGKAAKPVQLVKADEKPNGQVRLAALGKDVFWLSAETRDDGREVQKVHRFSGKKAEVIVDTGRKKKLSELDNATHWIEAVAVLDGNVVVIANASPAYQSAGPLQGTLDLATGAWTITRDRELILKNFDRALTPERYPRVDVKFTIPAEAPGTFAVQDRDGRTTKFTTAELAAHENMRSHVVGRHGGQAMVMMLPAWPGNSSGGMLPYLALVPETELPAK